MGVFGNAAHLIFFFKLSVSKGREPCKKLNMKTHNSKPKGLLKKTEQILRMPTSHKTGALFRCPHATKLGHFLDAHITLNWTTLYFYVKKCLRPKPGRISKKHKKLNSQISGKKCTPKSKKKS